MKTSEDLRETKVFNLKILSPVHVGSRQGSIRGLEFVHHQGWVYLIDEDKLARLLVEKGAVSRFITTVEQGPVNIGRFLQNLGVSLDQVLPHLTRLAIRGGTPEMQEFRPHIRDAYGRVFLPGSTIKGVFRTAILYRLLADPQWAASTKDLVERQTPCQSYRTKVWFSQNHLQRQGLQDFSLIPAMKKIGPQTDILRCLTIRDAYPLDDVTTSVVSIDFLSYGTEQGFYFSKKKKGAQDALHVWVEAIDPSSQDKPPIFRLDLVWNRELFDHFRKNNKSLPVRGLEDLLTATEDLNNAIIEHERNFYAQVPPSQPQGAFDRGETKSPGLSPAESLGQWYAGMGGSLLRLGFGVGMLSTTINLRLDKTQRQKIRDHCGHARPGDVAPKSRRIWRNFQGQCYPLGWIEINPQH
jgi:CRISPR-associated protein Csm5